LDIRILSGPFIVIVYGLSLIVAVYLLARRSTRTRLLALTSAATGGALIGLLTCWLVGDVWDVFGTALTPVTRIWACLTFAGIAIAIVSLRDSRRLRKVIAGTAIALFALTGAVGINVDFAEFSTIRAALGLGGLPLVSLPAVAPASADLSGGPLAASWSPPANMPGKGKVGTAIIPASVSKFEARDTLIYLPPAALTAHPPKLPVLVMLSGQPGAPYNIFDTGQLPDLLDKFAQSHHGLAPILVVPDQLGSVYNNPMCVDSPLGNSATYLTVDVQRWIRTHLNVQQDPVAWAVGGYSQGGTCSIQLAAAHPEIFGSFIDIAGELAEHVGSAQNTIDKAFGGSAAAYDAAKPLAILARHAPYRDTAAIFTFGQDDRRFAPGQRLLGTASERAGIKVTLIACPNSAHDWNTMRCSLAQAMPILYKRWQLNG
jgi:enterochelin esterase-like enzyme